MAAKMISYDTKAREHLLKDETPWQTLAEKPKKKKTPGMPPGGMGEDMY